MKIKIPKNNKRIKQSSQGNIVSALKDRLKKTGSGSTAAEQGPVNFAVGTEPEGNAFAVSVRNPDPIIRRPEKEKARKIWLRDLQVNLATAAVIMLLFALILTTAYSPELIPFAIPAFVVFMLLTTLESLDKGKIKLIAAAVIGVALIAALIIFRKYIGNGWALIMDQFYDTAEESQAYIYDRFTIGSTGDEHPYRSMHFALLWGSALLGLIMAIPPASFRRSAGTALAGFTMIAFAYYGIIPSGICIAVFAAAAVFLLSRGHILSSLPVLLIAMIIFGAIMLVDPGENYGISRADESFRDRFALRSSYLENGDGSLEDMDDFDEESQEQMEEGGGGAGSEFIAQHKGVISLLTLFLILAAAAAAALLFRKRLQKRQLANRAGIDSSDPKEAIVAMFPYAVRWLQPAGIDAAGRNFDSLIPMIRAEISERYAEGYSGMYEMWKEAAYSDHSMDEERKQEMNAFLQETINMIKDKGNFGTNLINTIKYAL